VGNYKTYVTYFFTPGIDYILFFLAFLALVVS